MGKKLIALVAILFAGVLLLANNSDAALSRLEKTCGTGDWGKCNIGGSGMAGFLGSDSSCPKGWGWIGTDSGWVPFFGGSFQARNCGFGEACCAPQSPEGGPCAGNAIQSVPGHVPGTITSVCKRTCATTEIVKQDRDYVACQEGLVCCYGTPSYMPKAQTSETIFLDENGRPASGSTVTNPGARVTNPGRSQDGGVAQTPGPDGAQGLGAGDGTGATASTPGQKISIDFQSPLETTTVEGTVVRILRYLQGVVVVVVIIFLVIAGVMYVLSVGDERKMENAKHAMTASIIGLAIILAAPSFLAEILTILGGNNSLINTSEISGALGLRDIANNVLLFLLSIVGILAIIGLLIGSVMYLTAVGDEKRMDKAKSIVKTSLIGIIVAMSALVIVKQIADIIAGR